MYNIINNSIHTANGEYTMISYKFKFIPIQFNDFNLFNSFIIE